MPTVLPYDRAGTSNGPSGAVTNHRQNNIRISARTAIQNMATTTRPGDLRPGWRVGGLRGRFDGGHARINVMHVSIHGGCVGRVEAFITTASSVPTWKSPLGRPHVYLLPDEATVDYAVHYQDLLADVDDLPVQPRAWLHMTVENFNRRTDNLTATQVQRLSLALADQLARVDPFDHTIGPALASHTSIALDATLDQPWHQVRAAVRTATADVLGPDAMQPMSRPGRPHITLAYATGHVDVDPCSDFSTTIGPAGSRRRCARPIWSRLTSTVLCSPGVSSRSSRSEPPPADRRWPAVS